MKDIWLKIIASSGTRVYALLLGLASLAVTARLLGPEGRGVVAGVTAWGSLFSTIGSMSIGQVVIHHAAKQRDKCWLEPVFGVLLFMTVILSVLMWLVAAGIGYIKADIYGDLPRWALQLGFLSMPFLIWQSYGSNLLISSGNLRFYNRAQLFASSVGFLAIVIALVFFDRGVAGVLMATLATTALMACIGISKLWRLAGERIVIQARVVLALLKDGLRLHLNAVGGVLLTLVNTLMINYYSTTEQVGWYQFASQMIATIIILPQALQSVLYEMTAQSGPDQVWPHQRRILVRLIGIMLLAIALIHFLSPLLVVFIAGERFLASVEVLQPLLISTIGVSMSYGMANQWLGRGLFLQTALLTLTSGIINVGLNAWFIPQYGMIAAAWSLAFVYSLGFITNLGMAVYVECKWRQQTHECRTK
jgi:O-antigen/teichoic acid export membrane protein